MKGSVRGACAVAGMLVLGACGSDGPKVVDADDYADAVCSSFEDWSDEFADTDLTDAMTSRDPAEGKRVLKRFMARVVEASDELVATIEGAGVPDVDDGSKLAATLLRLTTDVRDGFQAAREDVDDLPVDDLDAFVEDGTDIQDDLAEIASDFTSELRDDRDLVDLFEDSDCAVDETTPEDVRDAAEKAVLGQGAESVDCDVPDDVEPGTTFRCVTTFSGVQSDLQVTITPDGDINIVSV